MADFCTISTASHLFKAYALAESLDTYKGHLHILVIDDFDVDSSQSLENVTTYPLETLKTDLAIKIIEKYDGDKLRWSLKSIWLMYLLKLRKKVIYLDNDIYCFADFGFLFKELEQKDILLTPHYYPQDPQKDQNWFEANFKVGLYNAGFVAVNANAEKALNWWANACLYRCEKSNIRGLYDDQKYLDLMPIIHPNSKILHHKGCNVAEWNREVCARTLVNEKVLIDRKYEIVFYHFNNYSLNILSRDEDNPLYFMFEAYIDHLKQFNPQLKMEDLIKDEPIFDKVKLAVWKWLDKLNS